MLFSILEMLFRHRWRYLALFVVLPLIGAAICVPLFPRSTATMSIWVQDQTLLNTSQPTYNAYLTPAQITQADMEQYFQTQVFANGVRNQLLSSGVATSPSQATAIASGLSADLTAATSGNNLITLDYTCSQAALCPRVLTTALGVYETYSAANASNELKVAQKAYQQQLTQAQQQLSTANSALSSYLSQHPGETASTTSDPTLSSLTQSVASAQEAVQAAQSKLAGIASQASTAKVSASAMYTVMDAPHTVSGHVKNLPTKQMLMVACVFWAIAGALLIVGSRVSRVVRHPNQLETALGIPVAAVMRPIPTPSSSPRQMPRLTKGASA